MLYQQLVSEQKFQVIFLNVYRLVHRSEIINIEAESYRLKEAKEESAKRKVSREKKIKPAKHSENNGAQS